MNGSFFFLINLYSDEQVLNALSVVKERLSVSSKKAHSKATLFRRALEAVEQAYCIVVIVGNNNDIQAFKINVGGEPLFNLIKAQPKSRIQETAITVKATAFDRKCCSPPCR